jgi:hypothetical protein
MSPMALSITELGVTVYGQITRKFDKGANKTTLLLSEGQVRELYRSLGQAMDFFDGVADEASD